MLNNQFYIISCIKLKACTCHSEVQEDIEKSHQQGFYSIPVFVFSLKGNDERKQKQWVVQGAADIEEFEELLQEIVACATA